MIDQQSRNVHACALELGIGTLRVSRPETNIESALNWNAKLEGCRGIVFQSLLMQDSARDQYAHALCTLRSIQRNGSLHVMRMIAAV
jgi:hypothetical protein